MQFLVFQTSCVRTQLASPTQKRFLHCSRYPTTATLVLEAYAHHMQLIAQPQMHQSRDKVKGPMANSSAPNAVSLTTSVETVLQWGSACSLTKLVTKDTGPSWEPPKQYPSEARCSCCSTERRHCRHQLFPVAHNTANLQGVPGSQCALGSKCRHECLYKNGDVYTLVKLLVNPIASTEAVRAEFSEAGIP